MDKEVKRGWIDLLFQAVNVFISAVKLGILTWEFMGIDSLLKPEELQFFGFIFQPWRLLLGRILSLLQMRQMQMEKVHSLPQKET